MDQHYQAPPLPWAFIWRRLHSLTGLFLVLFLIEHLFTNSQAALWIGDYGEGFISGVNWIQSLPYLNVIEIFLLGVPFLLHGAWGIYYLFSSQINVTPSDGSKPSLPEYARNQAYTWQRITSWILLIGIIGHVVQMRFLEYPVEIEEGIHKFYLVQLEKDPELDKLSERIGFTSYPQSNEALPPVSGKQVVKANSFGSAELLLVRETFKSPLMVFLYTLFVLAAVYHGFNGLWTFMISWGITLTVRSQELMRKLTTALMVLIAFFGLSAIWGSYWIN